MEYTTEAGLAERVELKSLAARFAELTDQRQRRGIRYPLVPLLVLIVLAKLCGADKPSAIADWVSERTETLKQALGLTWKRMPHAATYRRILAAGMRLDEVEQTAREFLAGLKVTAEEVLAMDGKSLRGTIPTGETQGAHLLSICQVSNCAVLGQTEVASTENEISAAPRLIAQVEVRGQTLTGDALLAQRKLSAQIVEAGGDYLWIIKANHPALRAEIELHFRAARLPACFPAEDFRTHTTLEKGHGRIEQRTLTASTGLTGYLDWPYLQQVFELKRERFICRTGERHTETVYGLTSHTVAKADAARLLHLNRSHWGIENGLHYRRDVTFGEDRCRMKSKTAAHALAVFNNLAIGLIAHAGWRNAAQARRHYDANFEKALRLILESPS